MENLIAGKGKIRHQHVLDGEWEKMNGEWSRWKWKTASEEKGREREVKFFWTGSRSRWKLFGKDEKLRISGYGH